MKLYFSPLACSMATRIALYEAGIPADYQHVDHTTRRAPDGTDLRDIHPLGYVPVLYTDDGTILTENAAILQYVTSLAPPGTLAPADRRASLQQWLSFVGTELHKAVFIPLLDRTSPEGAKDYALANAERSLTALAKHLERRSFVLDTFSVADAYLVTVLNWTQATSLRLSRRQSGRETPADVPGAPPTARVARRRCRDLSRTRACPAAAATTRPGRRRPRRRIRARR